MGSSASHPGMQNSTSVRGTSNCSDQDTSPRPTWQIPPWLHHCVFVNKPQLIDARLSETIREGFVPTIWKPAEVVPVHKIHPPASIQNDLRPISLLPTVSKVLEGIVRDWLMPSLEQSLDENQFGCRPGRSTTQRRM